MEQKYIKDFVIIMVVLMLLAFGIKASTVYRRVIEVPQESEYKDLGLSEELYQKIKKIDSSIQERRNFVFSVEKDPLEQNLIVKTQQDLVMQWQEEVDNMVRLEMTMIPEIGEKQAAISYKGTTTLYSIGDKFELGTNYRQGVLAEITDIRRGEISFVYNGKKEDMEVKPIPPKPAKLKTNKRVKASREYNW